MTEHPRARLFRFIGLLLAAAALGACAPEPVEKVDEPKSRVADLAFTNGSIYTEDGERSWAQSIAIDDGHISYVGTDAGAKNYIGPGFELVAFDPKTSISFIGREAFESEATLAEVARLAGDDSTPYNQGACVSSRIQYIEASVEQADRYCALLQQQLGVERRQAAAVGQLVDSELREQIEALIDLEPDYRVWGKFDGRGIVIRSEEPVDFYCDRKTVNVVPVKSLRDAVRYANVATQTVGVYPAARKVEVRDALASAGCQRVVTLGKALGPGPGLPHDGFYPLHRFVRWVNDED